MISALAASPITLPNRVFCPRESSENRALVFTPNRSTRWVAKESSQFCQRDAPMSIRVRTRI